MTQIEAEAVLCEDGRAVMVYLYRGDDLIGIGSQSLPLTITEEAFEAVRPEWEETWGAAGPGGEVPSEIRFPGQTRAIRIRTIFSARTEFPAESKKSRKTQTHPHFSSEKPPRHEGSIMKQMPGLDVLAAAEAVRCARSTMFLGMEIASRLTDVLIAKGVLTRGEAKATLYAMAESLRDDAGGTGSEETTEAIARYLEKVGDSFKA